MTKMNYERLKLTTLVILVFSLVLLVFGATYAICSNLILGTTDNILEAGMLSFSFNEDAFLGNGINIENALPTSDERGKILNSTSQYFDFSVNALATIAPLSYQVVVIKQDNSTFKEENVKIYLTLRNGTTETPSPLVLDGSKVVTYNQLQNSINNEGKVVYNGVVPKSESEYNQSFRLRMWISEDVDVVGESFSNKTFSVKVKVIASE